MSRCWISVTGIFCHILQHQLLPLLNLGDKACLGLDHCVMLTIDMQTQSVKDAFITPAQDSCLRPRIRLLHVTEDDRESMQSRMSSQKHHTRPEFASVDNNEWIVSAWHAWVFNSGLIFHCTWIILCLAVIHFRAGWLGPYSIPPLNLQGVYFPCDMATFVCPCIPLLSIRHSYSRKKSKDRGQEHLCIETHEQQDKWL